MRIAHLNLAAGFRGGERQTELLVRDLAAAGFRQLLIARRNRALARRMRDAPVEVLEVRPNFLSAVLALRDVDLIHVHEGRSIYAAYMRSLLSATPYIVTRRVNNPIGKHLLAHQAYVRAACVVGVSENIMHILEQYDPRIRVHAIRSASSGLQVNASAATEIRGRYAGKFLVGHVGALDIVQKAQGNIIRVARELQETHPEIHFVLVGGGSDEAQLRHEAAGLRNLDFTGFVENVGDYLAAFDLFILPSNKEGIGGILLDAMDQALPVVASRVGGVPEIVLDGENGELIEPANPAQLRAAILKLKAAPDLMRRYGDRGREISGEYTAAAMSRKYQALYRTIV